MKKLCAKIMLTPYLCATSRAAMRRFLPEVPRVAAEDMRTLDLNVVRVYVRNAALSHLAHLEQYARQSGDWESGSLDEAGFRHLLQPRARR